MKLSDYDRLTIVLIREDAETWFAKVEEMPGCMTEGDNITDVLEMLANAITGWIEVMESMNE